MRPLTREQKPALLAIIAGLIIVASGIVSGSILLTALGYVDNFIGATVGPSGQFVLQVGIAILSYIVGLGGISVIIGGSLLYLKHGSSGRFFIGLGGGTAIIGLLFVMIEALSASGFSAPIFDQPFYMLYWAGAILATVSILLSRKVPATKPII